MSVYTQLDKQDIQSLLTQYNLGQLVRFEGVAAGVENTNYKLTLKQDGVDTSYFLTLFETLEKSELNFFLPLLAHLQDKDCLLASPIQRLNGDLVLVVKGKPAAVFNCLSGGHPEVSDQHCKSIGAELARIHLAAKDFNQIRDNSRGFYWIQHQIKNQCVDVSEEDFRFLEDELGLLKQQRSLWESWSEMQLPKGIIHGDLFDDNALFDGESLSGVIDFYNACTDFWAYDLAITQMAWALNGTELDRSKREALMAGYETVRQLTAEEKQALPYFLRMAALRFWLSRLHTQKQQQGVEMTTEKAPEQMRDLLVKLRNAEY